MRVAFFFAACLASLLLGAASGYHAGRESIKQQVVSCQQKDTSTEIAIFMCVPVNQ